MYALHMSVCINFYTVNQLEVNRNKTRNCKHHRAAAKLAAYADTLSEPNLACDSWPVVYAFRLNCIWITVSCRPRGV